MISNLLGIIKRQLIRFTMVNLVLIFLTVVMGFYHSKLLSVTSTIILNQIIGLDEKPIFGIKTSPLKSRAAFLSYDFIQGFAS